MLTRKVSEKEPIRLAVLKLTQAYLPTGQVSYVKSNQYNSGCIDNKKEGFFKKHDNASPGTKALQHGVHIQECCSNVLGKCTKGRCYTKQSSVSIIHLQSEIRGSPPQETQPLEDGTLQVDCLQVQDANETTVSIPLRTKANLGHHSAWLSQNDGGWLCNNL